MLVVLLFLKYFIYFSQRIGFDFSCKLSRQPIYSGKSKKNIIELPRLVKGRILKTYVRHKQECSRFQNLFSGKNEINISVCHLLKILHSMLSIKK